MVTRSEPHALNDAGALFFEVDAALLLELGEKLVARRSVALAELIKNAYDADATQVTVEFQNVSRQGGTIVVTDDGHGINHHAFLDTWMRIATNEKAVNCRSPRYHRVRTGAKGVGRFAARRLSGVLVLRTTARIPDGCERLEAEVDWDAFKPGLHLRDIPVKLRCETLAQSVRTGTELLLLRVRDAWSKGDIAEVRRDVLSLMPPFALAASARVRGEDEEADPGFRVHIVAPEFPEETGVLHEPFLKAAPFKLEGLVADDGSPRYTVVERGKEQAYVFSPAETFFPDLRGASCVVYCFVYETPYLEGTAFGVREARTLGREHGGVRVYLDGFRVFPYGERGDDWLGLDADRGRRLQAIPSVLEGIARGLADARPMLLLPGNNQLFGAALISRLDHPNLIPTIGREHLQDNAAFKQLVSFVRLGIDLLTIRRAESEFRHMRARTATTVADVPVRPEARTEAVIETLEEARKALSESGSDPDGRMRVQVERAVKIARSDMQERISLVSMLRVLASAGAATVILSHEIRSVIDGARRLHRELDALRAHVAPEAVAAFDALVGQLKSWGRMLELQATQIGVLISPESRLRRKRLVLRHVIEEVSKPLSLYMDEHAIVFENGVPPHLRTPPMFEAELHSILLNVLTNAIKAVRNQPTRRIGAFGEEMNGALCIELKDTGYGVLPENRERAFDAFVTTSPPDPVLGVGTGLGLTIVRDIVRENGGTVGFVDTASPWVTCVQIVLPEGVD